MSGEGSLGLPDQGLGARDIALSYHLFSAALDLSHPNKKGQLSAGRSCGEGGGCCGPWSTVTVNSTPRGVRGTPKRFSLSPDSAQIHCATREPLPFFGSVMSSMKEEQPLCCSAYLPLIRIKTISYTQDGSRLPESEW